jgi:protein involved in polysaccharide export with SLBB domain
MRVLNLLALVSALSLAACSRPTGDRPPPRTICQNRSPGIGPTDVINVVVFNEPSLSGEYRVGEDGTIDYPYLRRVRVNGMQTSEVGDLLRNGLAEQTAENPSGHSVLANPNVRVEIKEANSRRISVSGQVQHPNQYAFTRCLTVTQAIALAGGFTALAEKNQVRVTRVDVHGARRVFVLRVEEILEGRRDDFDLEPGDVIYVPESVT